MALNSNVGASFLSAKNENFLALANIAADFSLVKIEVPKQFEGLGNALSVQRRENAEQGSQHRAARRLGLLFEQLIPDIKDLVAAYGTRASEIARSSKLDTAGNDYGPFAGHVGIDGTSIYAAASSGPTVIALHLLACMLARLFSSAEATAIWVQLVECRLREIQQQADASQLQGLAALYAAEHGRQILRTDLAEWDASARAWLEAADQVKRREHTQLKLIIQNIPSIQHSSKTYANVIENWVSAMNTVQQSIRGVPQDVSNGGILLGLMAWHIYPDLNVFNPNRYIEFQDQLVQPGGIITLGLEQKDKGIGVSWSMSLSHLRFYGDPVVLEKSSGEDGDRVTAQELQLITLGCVLSSWTNPSSVSIIDAAECFLAIESCLGLDICSSEDGSDFHSSLGWLKPLFAASRFLVNAKGKDYENALYMVEFGRRRGRKFLDIDFTNTIPMFGLVNPLLVHTITKYDSTETLEGSIFELRQLARNCQFHQDDCIILSRPDCKINDSANPMPGDKVSYIGNWEVASAIPLDVPTGKRDIDGHPRTTGRYFRWVHVDRTKELQLQRSLEKQVHIYTQADQAWDSNFLADTDMPLAGTRNDLLDETHCTCGINQPCDSSCYCVKMGYVCTSLCPCVTSFMGVEESLLCANVRPLKAEADPPGEDCFWLSVRSIRDISHLSSIESLKEFPWHDPPNAILERYLSRGKVSGSMSPEPLLRYGSGLGDGDLDATEAEISHLSHEVWLNTVGGSLSVEDIDTALERQRHAKIEQYRQNAVKQKVTFHPVTTRGGAALLVTDRAAVNMTPWPVSTLTAILHSGIVGKGQLRSYLSRVPKTGISDYTNSLSGVQVYSEQFFTSLKAMSAVSELYQDFPEATISIAITKKALGEAHWVTELQHASSQNWVLIESRVHRSIKFSCLAMLESGVHSIHPDQLEHVMAMASGNSIYAAEFLVQDPSSPDRSGLLAFRGIKRILGSLGCPGIVLLVPPAAPLVRQVDPDSFRANLSTQAQTFDGQLELDSFKDTSLHLKFTPYKIPLATAPGAIDADVVLREALISVFDGSKWVADLDLLGTLAKTVRLEPPSIRLKSRMEVGPGRCTCPYNGQQHQKKDKEIEPTVSDPTDKQQNITEPLGQFLLYQIGEQLKSISSWDGLLVCKENLLRDEAGAIRAHGNWYARLAAASLGVRLGCTTVLFPPVSQNICLTCSAAMIEAVKRVESRDLRLFII